MFCSKCGATIADSGSVCDQCGRPIAGFPAQATPGATPQYIPAVGATTSGKALASMISGIFGLVFFLPAIAAIILGHMSRSEIRRSGGRLNGLGMSTAGLVMGYGVIAIMPFILIVAAIAIPNLLRARMAAHEASSTSSIRAINAAETFYRSAYPEAGFTCSLSSLGGTGSTPSAEHALLIDSVLASGQKSGYQFVLDNCVNTDAEHKYRIVAHPIVRNQTGIRTFCSDETGVIRSSGSDSAEDCLANGRVLR